MIKPDYMKFTSSRFTHWIIEISVKPCCCFPKKSVFRMPRNSGSKRLTILGILLKPGV